MNKKENNLAGLLSRTTKAAISNSNSINEITLATKLTQFEKADEIMHKVATANPEEQQQIKDAIKYVTYAIPESFTNIVDQLIKRCMREEININKSEIVRLGIQMVNELHQDDLVERLQAVKLAKGRRKLL